MLGSGSKSFFVASRTIERRVDPDAMPFD